MNAPLSGIDGSLVNVDSSNYGGGVFTSRVIPSTVNPAVLPEPLSNIQAARSYIPCPMKGGKKRTIYRRKIKNINNMYKMNKKRKSIRRKGKRTKRRLSRRSTRSRTRSRRQRGGYAQYQNNLPNTPSYSLGGKLSPNMSALANPPPLQRLSNCTNCVDNYSYFKNSGFPSKGWW